MSLNTQKIKHLELLVQESFVLGNVLFEHARGLFGADFSRCVRVHEKAVNRCLRRRALLDALFFEPFEPFEPVESVESVEPLDLFNYCGSFLPRSISDFFGSALDGSGVRAYLESHGVSCVSNLDYCRYGAAVTSSGFMVANNGYVSFVGVVS